MLIRTLVSRKPGEKGGRRKLLGGPLDVTVWVVKHGPAVRAPGGLTHTGIKGIIDGSRGIQADGAAESWGRGKAGFRGPCVPEGLDEVPV